MPKRKKHPRLPNGYGSIRYLGKSRKNPYAVHPPTDIDGNRPPALCYVDDWMKGFIILTSLKAGTYTPGMEATLRLPDSTGSLDALAEKIMADYNRVKGIEPDEPEKTFSEVYKAFYADKFTEGHKYSASTVRAIQAGYRNCKSLYDKEFRALRSKDLQDNLDACTLKHASLEHIKNLYRQMYKYADGQGWCDKDYSQYIKIKKADDDEHGVPFSDAELKTLWENVHNVTAEMILIICYSGWRISEYLDMKIDLDEKYFFGGSKTDAGKDRTVPIHSAIFPLVERRLKEFGCILPCRPEDFREQMDRLLNSLGFVNEPKHTPHDCRHTFSRLCEKYGVRENDRKRMLGHSFGNDITNRIYGHRELDDLRKEIEKIKVVL
ncbi:tyrosine-type recombinase/integrase [Enterocloster clostridioformis]